jgi:protein involved in polysaccharide export with SLBB domain
MRAPVLLTLFAILSSLSFGSVAAQVADAPEAVSSPSASSSASTATSYTLGSGDRLRIITFNEPALTGEFVVDGSGMISLPLIGNITAGGLTPLQLSSSIEASLRKGYIKEPRVSIQVQTFRPYYILGEVNKPGTYAYIDGLTVMNAVATASGFTYRANKKKAYIKHAQDPGEKSAPITVDLLVAPGDTIRIAERHF